jgi:single-strand DNA-binding protein
MKMINQVNIVGHVGAKPELTVFPSGKKLAKFCIAVNQPARPGDKEPQPLWLDIEAWEGVVDRMAKCDISKGKKIAISGVLAPNVYRKKIGDTHFDIAKVKVKMISFELMSSAKKEEPEVEVSLAAYDQEPELTVHENLNPAESFTPRKTKRSK